MKVQELVVERPFRGEPMSYRLSQNLSGHFPGAREMIQQIVKELAVLTVQRRLHILSSGRYDGYQGQHKSQFARRHRIQNTWTG